MTKKSNNSKHTDQAHENLHLNEQGNGQNPEATAQTGGEAQPTVEELKQQLEDLKDKYLRLFAEFENYKRRTLKEKAEWIRTAGEDTMSALLPILDDFDRARKFALENDPQSWSEGLELLYQKLYTTLRNKGLEPMETTGETFDPDLHEAVTEIPATEEEMKGKVVDTIEKGYRLNDKIIRHAKVVVGK